MTRNSNAIIVFLVAGVAVTGAVFYGRGGAEANSPAANSDVPRTEKRTCINNLIQMDLAFKTWPLDNRDRLPWNLSTNAGGTMEFCVRGGDGFDSNAAIHFEVMSNELLTPLLLVCPEDKLKKAAVQFGTLHPENVTYRLRTGTNINRANPKQMVVVCPVDGNKLLCDGTIVDGKTGKPVDKSPSGSFHVPPP